MKSNQAASNSIIMEERYQYLNEYPVDAVEESKSLNEERPTPPQSSNNQKEDSPKNSMERLSAD